MKNKIISILFSSLTVASAWVFPEKILAYIALILIISVGILHGANDILLIDKTNFVSTKYKKFAKWIYALVVIIAVGIFYFIPFYALLLFVIFSAYHFGEQHWQDYFVGNSYTTLKQVLQFTYGLSILSLIFLLQYEATNEIIFDLATWEVPQKGFLALFSGAIIMTIVNALFLIAKNELKTANAAGLFLLLFFLAVVFYLTPLVLGFAIYFAFWHSIPSLQDQINFVYEKNIRHGIAQYVRDAWIYWGISVIGFGLFVFIFYESKLFYSFLFAFIAAITFPHVLVMEKMFSYLKTKKES